MLFKLLIVDSKRFWIAPNLERLSSTLLIALSKVAKASSLTFKILTSLPASAVNLVVLLPVNSTSSVEPAFN